MRLVLEEKKAWQDSIELVFNSSAVSIIAARRFTEFIASPSHRVKFVARGSGNKKDKASLVVISMGDWMRYGIQPHPQISLLSLTILRSKAGILMGNSKHLWKKM